MKNIKEIVVTTLLLSFLQSKTDNLSDRTHNLNIIQLHKYASMQLSTGNDNGNILRDLACNCDNPDFEMTIAFTVKPFTARAEIKAILESPLVNPMFLKVCKRLAPDQNLNVLDALLRHPEIAEVAMQFYTKYSTDQIEKNMEEFFDNNMKELLLSKNSDGKSALDIVNGKPDELECRLLKKTFNKMKEIIDTQEKEKQ